MRTTVFLLDLISNALGAMLMLYFLAVPRRFEALPVEVEETLWIEASAAGSPGARVDLKVVWPDGSEAWCDPGSASPPLTDGPDRVAGHPPNQSERCVLLWRKPPAGSYRLAAYVFAPGSDRTGGPYDVKVEGWLSGRSLGELTRHAQLEQGDSLVVEWSMPPENPDSSN